MPPKKKAQSSVYKELCCVCCQPLVKEKDDALLCAGVCQQRFHRYCAGVSTQVYKEITEAGSPFYCYSCCLERHKEEISGLKDAVELLRREIAELKATSSPSSSVQQSSAPANPTLISSASSLPTAVSSEAEATASSPSRSTDAHAQERKYNVILYGLEESRGSSKLERLENDQNKAISVLADVDQLINANCIKDIYRLGKFSTENNKPRPLLIKFIRAAEAIKVLSKRRTPRGSQVVIKPDMSPHERKCESLLLHERWSLLQSGVPREHIKLRGSRLYVRKMLHGQVTSCGPELLFRRHNSSPIVIDSCSVVNNSVQAPTSIVPNPQSQVDNMPVAQQNVDTSLPGTQAHSSQPSPQPLSSSPDHLSQTSTSTPTQSLPLHSVRSSPALTDQ